MNATKEQLLEIIELIAPRLSHRFSDLWSYPFLVPTGDRLFSVYLLSFVLIGMGIYFFQLKRIDLDIRSIFKFLFPRNIYLNYSSFVDYKFYIVDRILSRIISFVYILSGFLFVGDLTKNTLTLFLGSTPVWTSNEFVAFLIFVYGIILYAVYDLGAFTSHYLHHKIPVLWEFHKVHHSAAVLTPITQKRFHPVEQFIQASIRSIFTGVVTGMFAYILGDKLTSPAGLTISFFNIGVIAFSFNIFANLRHSHIWLSYGPFLSRFLISPAQHQIHHSCEPRHIDMNLGLVLAIWDWIFGTLYVPRTKENFAIGLVDKEHEEYSGVTRLYLLPIKKAAHRMLAFATSLDRRRNSAGK